MDPATIASVWQFGPSGPMKAAMSLHKRKSPEYNLKDLPLYSHLQIKSMTEAVATDSSPLVSLYVNSRSTSGRRQEQLLTCSMA